MRTTTYRANRSLLRRSGAALAALACAASLLAVPLDASAASRNAAPAWRLLVLIYTGTDFTFTDAAGTHHVVAQMTSAEQALAASASTAFATQDVPALDSGDMTPTLTIRYPGTLTDLDAFGGWWPSPRVTVAALDPAFDSVIVIWDSTGTDLTTGQPYALQSYGGLTLNAGTGQTYSTFQVDGYPADRLRNVFKHEWGHAIVFYYDAAGTAPKPAVDNHQPGAYVNCKTGKGYVLVDETTDNPIRNSIYDDKAGFTRDYYSGETALAGTRTCLGITAAAWASGGPVSRPSGPRPNGRTAPGAGVPVPFVADDR